ncbi:hypothetical protein Tco_1101726 [Tanacetum coccineum]
MEDEHLDTTPTTESDEVIKSSVENLVQILSEFKGISEDTRDVPVCEDPSTFDALSNHSEILSDFNDDGTSSDNDSYENIEYVKASPLNLEYDSLKEKLLNISRLVTNIESLKDNPTPDYVFKSPSLFLIPVVDSDSFFEESDTSSDTSLPKFKTFSDHTEETRSGSTTTHANNYLPEFESFHFDLYDDPSFPRPPPKPPDVEISLIVETDAPVMNNFDNENECFDPGEMRLMLKMTIPSHLSFGLFSRFSLTLWILLFFTHSGVKTQFLTPASPLRAGGISSGWNFHVFKCLSKHS